MHGLHGAELVEAVGLAPGGEVGGGLGVGFPGVGVSDVGGEEFEDALGGRRVRGKQGREVVRTVVRTPPPPPMARAWS